MLKQIICEYNNKKNRENKKKKPAINLIIVKKIDIRLSKAIIIFRIKDKRFKIWKSVLKELEL